MKIFILYYLSQLTERYHSGGGLVVIAKDLDAVKEMVKKEKYIEITEEEFKYVEIFELKGNPEPKMWIMPDAGCC